MYTITKSIINVQKSSHIVTVINNENTRDNFYTIFHFQTQTYKCHQKPF